MNENYAGELKVTKRKRNRVLWKGSKSPISILTTEVY